MLFERWKTDCRSIIVFLGKLLGQPQIPSGSNESFMIDEASVGCVITAKVF